MPFRNGSSWTPIHYSPAMSNCPSNPAKELYYKLYDSTKAKAIGSVYMRSPKEWTAGNHPCISEAAEGSELGYITSNMYGIETVPRANYTNHPLADQHFLLFVATDLISMMVPIFLRNPHDPSAMDDIIGRMTMPFWKNGLGKVLCPVCLLPCCVYFFSHRIKQQNISGLHRLYVGQAGCWCGQAGGQA
jgi:hypothetical protein